MRDMARHDRPRERLLQVGSMAVSTAELLAIILRTGTGGENVLHLAERLLAALEQIDDDDLKIRVNPEDHQHLEGLMPPGVELETDPRLGRGDAVASGRWSRADLTLERAWQLIAGGTRG